jgi:hypothetical protein
MDFQSIFAWKSLPEAGFGKNVVIDHEASFVSHLPAYVSDALNANGENPKVVQELLRHANLKVTTDVYMQAVGPQKREAQSDLVKLVRKGAVSESKSA